MVDPRIVDYVKKGTQQGFNIAYIKDVLLKHGYNTEEVDTAIVAATTSEPTKKPREKSRALIVGGTILLGVVFILLLINVTKDDNLTGKATTDIKKELTIQEYLDQIAELSEEIDGKEHIIEKQIDLTKQLGFSVEEKDQVIEEIEKLYRAIKNERKEVKDALFDLLDQIINRFREE